MYQTMGCIGLLGDSPFCTTTTTKDTKNTKAGPPRSKPESPRNTVFLCDRCVLRGCLTWSARHEWTNQKGFRTSTGSSARSGWTGSRSRHAAIVVSSSEPGPVPHSRPRGICSTMNDMALDERDRALYAKLCDYMVRLD